MIYANVVSGIATSIEVRPRWFNDDGSSVSDEQLIELGYFPLDRAPPAYDPITHYLAEDPISEWAVQADKVVTTYTVHAYDAEAIKQNLRDYAYRMRKEREAAGLVFGGMIIPVDDTSKANLTGARIKADADAEFSTMWRSPNGTFTAIAAAQIIAISDAVLDFVDDLFRLEAEAVEGIDEGTITTTAGVDAVFAA